MAEEKFPFPAFKGEQMNDLIAYLHGGGPAPMVGKEHMGEEHRGK